LPIRTPLGEKARDLDSQTVPKRIPTAVLWETYTGIGNVASEETAKRLRAQYQRLVAARSVVHLTPDVARRAGMLNGEHMSSDQLSTLDGADSIVAAHGLARGEPVVSNDTDFQDVQGLSVVTY
jgi:predicted nucleic acid-binding protein